MKRGLLYFLFFLSGVAGLGYEILWTRMFSVSLGHEIVAVLAVIGAFFSSLGLGTGATISTAANHPELQTDGVELLPEVIDVMDHFQQSTGDLDSFDNLHLITADARRFVTATEKKYDVVVADLFHPARDGAGSLYTVEHFTAISRLLSEDGLFCQWLPLYQLDLDMLRVTGRTGRYSR